LRVVVLLGVDTDAVHVLVGTIEELGDVTELVPCLGDGQRIAILSFEGGHFFGVFQAILAICPAHRVTFGRVAPVAARTGRELTVELERGGGHRLVDAVLDHEVSQFHVVALLRALAEPLAVAHYHIVSVALGRPFGGHHVIEAAPRFLNNVNLNAGLSFVAVTHLLQVIGGRPLGPEDGQLGHLGFGRGGRTANAHRQGEDHRGQHQKTA